MKASTERKIVRWLHIILSIPVLGYIYGPVASVPMAANAVRFVFLPVVVLSGFWMWKRHWFRKKRAQAGSTVQAGLRSVEN